MAQSDESRAKVKALTDKLEAGVKAVFEDENYLAYLKAMSQFHHYSFRNVMLILLQCPHASLVAGYNDWKKKFDRHVKAGENGIAILAPSPRKFISHQLKTDPNTKQYIIGEDGKPETEPVIVRYNEYRVVYVYDVSQTEGKELPSYGVDELVGDVAHYDKLLSAISQISPVPIEFMLPDKTDGLCSYKEQKIYISKGMSQLHTIEVMIHEVAHAKLHDWTNKNEDYEQKNRRTREVEAESVAFVVCQHFGLDPSASAFPYIAGWSKGKELEELNSSLERISKTASYMIEQIEKLCPEISRSITPSKAEHKKRNHASYR